MKFTTKFLLIVVFWAALAAAGAGNLWRALETEREFAQLAYANPFAYIFSFDRPPAKYARQQIRLCEWALATEPDTRMMQEAETKFRGIQQRYGQLRIDDPHAAAIVTIPEIWLPERLEYAWRIHVPVDQQVELAAYTGDGDNTASRWFTNSDFAQTLPPGESVIRFVCEKGQLFEWGSVAPKDIPKWASRLTVSINEDDFRWQSNCSAYDAAVYANQYPSQQTLFGSEDIVELTRVGTLSSTGSQEDLRLVVRQTKLAPAE